MKFDVSFRNYVSFRYYDLSICSGELETNPVYIYGDSFATSLFDKFTGETRIFSCAEATMGSIGKSSAIPNYVSTEVGKHTTLCFVYGEADIRLYSGQGGSLKSVCKELVTGYLQAIHDTVKLCKKVIIIGAVPPPTGSPQERVFYTALMNSFLEMECIKYGYTFFAPYDLYTDSNGCFNCEQDTQYFLDEFRKIL
jgi:hypothetical protein